MNDNLDRPREVESDVRPRGSRAARLPASIAAAYRRVMSQFSPPQALSNQAQSNDAFRALIARLSKEPSSNAEVFVSLPLEAFDDSSPGLSLDPASARSIFSWARRARAARILIWANSERDHDRVVQNLRPKEGHCSQDASQDNGHRIKIKSHPPRNVDLQGVLFVHEASVDGVVWTGGSDSFASGVLLRGADATDRRVRELRQLFHEDWLATVSEQPTIVMPQVSVHRAEQHIIAPGRSL